jgi:hypothetical protein
VAEAGGALPPGAVNNSPRRGLFSQILNEATAMTAAGQDLRFIRFTREVRFTRADPAPE